MLRSAMGTVINIDGRLLPPEEATISVLDRGFLYGDSIYEVIRTYGGRPFELDAHLDRLEGSAGLIALTLPWDKKRFSEEIQETIRASANIEAGRETYVRLVVTRGSGEIGLDPALAVKPRTVIISRPLVMPSKECYESGVEVAVVSVQRVAPEAINPAAKTGNYLNNLLALKEARDRGAYEAVMLDGKGRLTEGSTSNVFIVKDGKLVTPPTDAGILEGVTRRVILLAAQDVDIAASQLHLEPDDLREADEAFITSSIREILPVTRVDGEPVGEGRVGSVTKKLQAAFRERTGVPVDGEGF